MGKIPKSQRKKLESLIQQRQAHLEKIRNALDVNENIDCIPHWKREIENFTRQIDHLLKRMGRISPSPLPKDDNNKGEHDA